jgi:hypothetical protein
MIASIHVLLNSLLTATNLFSDIRVQSDFKGESLNKLQQNADYTN